MAFCSSADFRAKLSDEARIIDRIDPSLSMTIPSLISCIGTNSCVVFEVWAIFYFCFLSLYMLSFISKLHDKSLSLLSEILGTMMPAYSRASCMAFPAFLLGTFFHMKSLAEVMYLKAASTTCINGLLFIL